MNPIKKILKPIHSEVQQSNFIPFTHLNAPTVFESKNGMLGMVIQFSGVAFDTVLDSTLNDWKRRLHHALSALDERFCLLQTTHRRLENKTLAGEFTNTFARELDAAYHQQFNEKNMYVNDLYLTVLYKGITSGKVGKGLSLLTHLKDKAVKEARAISRAKQMKALTTAVNQLLVLLAEFNPHLIGSRDHDYGYSELCAFLSLWVNGGELQRLQNDAYFSPIGKSFKESKQFADYYPQGHLAPYLSSSRLFFGKALQFTNEVTGGIRFAAMISVKHYASTTASIMLDNLLQLDAEFIATHSFSIENKAQSLYRIKAHEIKLRNAGDEAHSEMDALNEAKDEVASNKTTMGYHHTTLMILAASLEELEKRVNGAIKCYSEAGFIALQETLGMVPAFWSQLPTNLNYIARSSLITLENFVDFAPLHNYHTGFRDENHLGSAVTLLETPSKTPLFFNYHVKGRKGNPSKGHALIIGGNDLGKTALMTFMDAQMQRYGGSTFYFDRDQGAKIYILASSGYYAVLSPNYPESTCFNPFKLPDTPENRSFCLSLLMALCQNTTEDHLNAHEIEILKRCVDYSYEKLAYEFRQLSFMTQLLPIEFSRWPALRRWLRGQGQFMDGEYAYLFDNPIDTLALHCMMGFDMTHFLDNEPSHVRTPLMMYLFHRIKERLDGRRVSILLDEGWQYFIDPYWSKALEKLLPTLRKYNGHLVIATQSPSSVLKSSIAAMMLDNIPTKIFFANPQAKESDYIDGFNLLESEYQIILNNPPESRLFLYKQDKFTSLCRLNLSPLPQYLSVLSGNKETARLVDALITEQGEKPENWLPPFYQRQQEKTK